jgi:electron transfer flavoprotein beta subunit
MRWRLRRYWPPRSGGLFDLVVAGVESTDGATGTMPMALAAMLEIPSATFARRLEVADARVLIARETASGDDVVECPLPALVSVRAAIAEPRYRSLREKVAAKKKPTERVSLGDLGLGRAGHQAYALSVWPGRPGNFQEGSAARRSST